MQLVQWSTRRLAALMSHAARFDILEPHPGAQFHNSLHDQLEKHSAKSLNLKCAEKDQGFMSLDDTLKGPQTWQRDSLR